MLRKLAVQYGVGKACVMCFTEKAGGSMYATSKWQWSEEFL